jgi:hypothetical protein
MVGVFVLRVPDHVEVADKHPGGSDPSTKVIELSKE